MGLITIEQTGKNGIVIFEENGVRTISNFHPYFYVEDLQGEHISLFGEKCRKIVVDSPMDVMRERDKYGKNFEGDIQYRERYLIDNISIPIPKSELHIVFLDIETDMSLDTENAPKPITCITIYSTKLQKYITFVWRQDLEKKKVNEVYYFNNEKEMLLNFIKCIKDIKPHLLSGWNSSDFDLTYIINRCKNIGINYYHLSPMNKVEISKYGDVRIYGCVIFDLMKAYKKLQQNLLESYSLKSIAQKELKDEKLEVELEDVWQKDIEKLVEYNRKDVELCKRINDKIGIIDFFDELRREIGCLWESLWFSSNVHDVALLRLAKKRNVVLPSKVHRSEREPFEGAIVIDSKPGIYDNVICLDVKSLYPSIIMQFKLNSEKLGGDDIVLPNGVRLSNHSEGFTEELLKGYFEKRKYYKKLMLNSEPDSEEYKTYHLKQWLFKINLNSFYGYLGYPKARLFNIDIAKSIPLMGRLILRQMKSVVENEKFEVISGDTDSLYVKMKTSELNEIIKQGKKLTEKINYSFDNFVKQFGCKQNMWLEVEFEKVNKKMFFGSSDEKGKAAKKRYAYHEIWREGKEVNKMGVIGYEMRRSDAAKVTSNITQKVFEMLLMEGKGKEEVMNYVNGEIKKIKSMQYSYEEIAFPKTLTDDFENYKVQTFHVKAAQWSNKHLGTSFKKGSKMKIIYGHIEGLPTCDAFAFNNNKQLEKHKIYINWDKMIEVLVENKVNRIYSALNWNTTKQKSLF